MQLEARKVDAAEVAIESRGDGRSTPRALRGNQFVVPPREPCNKCGNNFVKMFMCGWSSLSLCRKARSRLVCIRRFAHLDRSAKVSSVQEQLSELCAS